MNEDLKAFLVVFISMIVSAAFVLPTVWIVAMWWGKFLMYRLGL